MNEVPVIGLVGGVGSGKSSVAQAAARHSPVHSDTASASDRSDLEILSGDAAGHRVLEFPDVQEAIRLEFGEGVFGSDGQIHRSALAKRVFGAGQVQQQALKQLESIVHPRIQQLLTEQIKTARRRPDVRAILLDAAILFEAGWNRVCDAVVFIETIEDERLRRVQQSRGWSIEQFRQREESQWPLEEKRRHSDAVVTNDSTLEIAGRRLRDWIESFLSNRK